MHPPQGVYRLAHIINPVVISTGGPAIDPGERSESHQKIGGVLNVETGRAVVLSWSNSEDRPGEKKRAGPDLV